MLVGVLGIWLIIAGIEEEEEQWRGEEWNMGEECSRAILNKLDI